MVENMRGEWSKRLAKATTFHERGAIAENCFGEGVAFRERGNRDGVCRKGRIETAR